MNAHRGLPVSAGLKYTLSNEVVPDHVLNFEQKIGALLDELQDIADSAEDCGMMAITHKINEATGRLDNARTAAGQYETGELTPR